MHTKRIAAGGVKGVKWTATPRGPHRKKESMPLVDVIKALGFADNTREARKIIVGGMVNVDGEKCRTLNHGVGLMDVVSIPSLKKDWRMVPRKNGMIINEIPHKDAKLKPCKVKAKRLLPKGVMQVTVHDGYAFNTEKKYSVNDTLVFEIPERKVAEVVPYAAGSSAIVVSGRHRGKSGEIKEIVKGSAANKSLTTVGDAQTLTDYVFVTGKAKPVVEV